MCPSAPVVYKFTTHVRSLLHPAGTVIGTHTPSSNSPPLPSATPPSHHYREYPGWEHENQPIPGMKDSGNSDNVRDCSATPCVYAQRTQDGVNFVKMLTVRVMCMHA